MTVNKELIKVALLLKEMTDKNILIPNYEQTLLSGAIVTFNIYNKPFTLDFDYDEEAHLLPHLYRGKSFRLIWYLDDGEEHILFDDIFENLTPDEKFQISFYLDVFM